MKKYNSLPIVSKDTAFRKRKCSGEPVSLPKAKEDIPHRNEQYTSKQTTTGEEIPLKQAKRHLKITTVLSESSGTQRSKQHGDGKRGASKDNYADFAVQTRQQDIDTEVQCQEPPMNFDDCIPYAAERRTDSLARGPHLPCQPASTSTRSQGIQTAHNLHTLKTHEPLALVTAENLHTHGLMYEGDLLKYSDSLGYGRISNHSWEELSHQSPWKHRTDRDQGSSGGVIPNPRENLSPRHELDLTQGKCYHLVQQQLLYMPSYC